MTSEIIIENEAYMGEKTATDSVTLEFEKEDKGKENEKEDEGKGEGDKVVQLEEKETHL